MKNRSTARLLAGLCLGAAAAAPSLRAETTATEPTPPPHRDGTVVVTATRVETNEKLLPINPIIITGEAVRNGQYRALPDALEKEAGLFFRESETGDSSQKTPDMRGFGENSHGRVLVLLNGRKLNRPDMAAISWSHIPLANVDRIEILPGAHTVMYGDHAVGGVINIITRRGTEKPEKRLQASVGSYETYEVNFSLAGQAGDTGYAALFNHQSSDGYRDRCESERYTLSLNSETRLNDWLKGWMDYSYTDHRTQLPGPLTTAQKKANRRQAVNQDDDVEETGHLFGFGMSAGHNDRHELSLDTGYSRKDQDSNMASWWNAGWTLGSYDTLKLDSWTVSPKYTHRMDTGNQINTLSLGADLLMDQLSRDHFSDRHRNNKLADQKVEKSALGVYLHDQLELSEHWIVSTGARKERAEYKVSGNLKDRETYNENAFHAGITWLPTEKLKLFTRFDKLYRHPFTDEKYSNPSWGNNQYPVKPERGKSWEAGTQYAFNEKINLNATVFRIAMQDEIAWNNANNQNENMDDTTHQGVELSAKIKPTESLKLTAFYTYQEVEFSSGVNKHNEVPLVPRQHFRLSTDWESLPGLHLLTGMTFVDRQYAGQSFDNAPGTELPSYALVDVGIHYVRQQKNFSWRLFAEINNLLDKEYTSMAFYDSWTPDIAWYPAQGRTFKTGLAIDF